MRLKYTWDTFLSTLSFSRFRNTWIEFTACLSHPLPQFDQIPDKRSVCTHWFIKFMVDAVHKNITKICLFHSVLQHYVFWTQYMLQKYTVVCIIKWNINKKAVLSQRWPCDARYISVSDHPLRRYGHSKLYKMAAGHQLWFDVTRNNAIRSADPENPTLEPNMKCIGSDHTLWRYGHSRILGAYGTPILGEVEGGSRGQRWHHSKQRWRFL